MHPLLAYTPRRPRPDTDRELKNVRPGGVPGGYVPEGVPDRGVQRGGAPALGSRSEENLGFEAPKRDFQVKIKGR